MRIKIKVLSLALIAVAAAIGVPMALAAAPEFNAEESPAKIYGVGNKPGHEHHFKFPNQVGGFVTVVCEKSTISITAHTVPTDTLTLVPNYSECKIAGETAFAERKGCEYKVKLVAASSPPTGKLDVVCPDGQGITFESAKCVIHVLPQTGRQHVVFSNTEPGDAEKRDVDATVSISDLEYKITPGCPGVFTTETKKTGTFTEELTLTADRNGKAEQQGFWVN